MATLRRALGAFLLAVSVLPIYRVLSGAATGPAGRATVELADTTLSLSWWGTLLVLGVSFLLGRGLPRADPSRMSRAVGGVLARIPPRAVPTLAALLAGLLCLAVGAWAFQGYPTLLDEMAQLLQARYFQGGMDGGPAPDPAAAWLIQNTLVSQGEWVSQYPPFHTLLLSLGFGLGRPWLVGPVLTAVTVFFATRCMERLFPKQPDLVSWGALLLALSPFVLALGSGYLSHVSAAALGAAGLWWGLRAADGRAIWALAAGLCVGLVLATRPLTGLALSGVFTLAVWVPEARSRGELGWLSWRLVLAGLGSLPGGLWLARYNARLFGDPLTFGYAVAQGPAHGLGFHADPWGNLYGPVQALGYTAADLLQLGTHLLETPLSVVALVGLYLLTTPSLARGTRLLLAWALLPLLANVFYWHHGYHLGPRMLYETAPAWLLLMVVSAFELNQWLPDGWLRRTFGWIMALSVLAALTLGVPSRLQSYRWNPETLDRIAIPSQSATSLVFVHGGWSGRLSAELAGTGMRLDSVETAIRRNDACAVHEYALARTRGGVPGEPVLDLVPAAGNAPGLVMVPVGEGSVVRSDPTRSPTPACRRQARSDRMGAIELAPLLWQGDLPGMEKGRAMFVRDLGPERNREVRVRYAGRPAFVFTAREPGGRPELIPYDQGMALLWGSGGGGPD